MTEEQRVHCHKWLCFYELCLQTVAVSAAHCYSQMPLCETCSHACVWEVSSWHSGWVVRGTTHPQRWVVRGREGEEWGRFLAGSEFHTATTCARIISSFPLPYSSPMHANKIASETHWGSGSLPMARGQRFPNLCDSPHPHCWMQCMLVGVVALALEELGRIQHLSNVYLDT